MPRIAFFDVDRTLLDINSASLWVRRELRTGRLTRALAAKAVGWTFLYELGFARIEQVLEDAVRTLRGQEEADMIARVAAFFEEEVASRIRPGAIRAIERHRRAGDAIALLTSSTRYLCGHVGRAVGAEHILSNALEVDPDGRFTGLTVKPLCFGPGKLTHASRLADQLTARLEDCAFYTDSYSDVPVLERVGHPVCVHPDPRLRREAFRRGWPIELWS